MYKSINELITAETTAYQSLPITVADGYDWSMARHINTTVLYLNSQYLTGKSDSKPFKNIIRPILNLAHRAEGFDVKDIQIFLNNSKKYFKSFLLKKYHEKWARENQIDTFIDKMVESYVDFGGALVKKVGDTVEVVPLQRLAFCDQTDILSGPICEKHFYSPDQLKEMEKKGWKNIDEVITLAQPQKTDDKGKQSNTPGKYIEVFEVHGVFPKSFLEDGEEGETYEEKYSRQLHICTTYQSKEAGKQYITLFKGPEKESPYKFKARDEVYGRALGMGGAEELFEAQVWTNYGEMAKKGLLDHASKSLLQTTDPAFANRNKTDNLENGEILITATGTTISPINNTPVNAVAFENAVREWEAHARQTGSANESIMGESPSSGTPFKLQELVTAESHSLHEYRKGQLATFLDEIYKDWILPMMRKEVVKGSEFLAELELDELQAIADSLVICETNKMIKQMILKGEDIYPDMIEEKKAKVREQFMKGGNKRFLEIFKDEMKDAEMDVYVNIAGKQKDLSKMTDKLVNILRQLAQNPAILDDPRMAKIFNQVLEASGLSPIDFYMPPKPPAPPALPPQQINPQAIVPPETVPAY